MKIIATEKEINTVLKTINPNFPEQKFEAIGSKECFYTFGGVMVEIFLADENV